MRNACNKTASCRLSDACWLQRLKLCLHNTDARKTKSTHMSIQKSATARCSLYLYVCSVCVCVCANQRSRQQAQFSQASRPMSTRAPNGRSSFAHSLGLSLRFATIYVCVCVFVCVKCLESIHNGCAHTLRCWPSLRALP